MGSPKVQSGRVKVKLGRKTKVCLPPHLANDALHVIGLHGSGDKISLFLQDWEFGQVAPSCHMALEMLYQEMRPGSGCGYREASCHGMSALLSPWTGRDRKGEGCGERKQ